MAEAAIIRAIAKISIALANKVGRQARVLKDLHGSMGRIESELKVVQKFLGRKDSRNYNNDAYECWIKLMRKVVYHIEDMVDEYETCRRGDINFVNRSIGCSKWTNSYVFKHSSIRVNV
jgi:hypothetical protein